MVRVGCRFAVVALLVAAGTHRTTAEDKAPKAIVNSIGMKLVLIPSGEFLMGSPENEALRIRDEQQHRVRITKHFYMGAGEVSQAQYQQIIGSNPSLYSPGGQQRDAVQGQDSGLLPVERITWNDAQEFCRRLSQKEGRKYRLPTEAEWEYACRAGTTTAYNFGPACTSAAASVNINPASFPRGQKPRAPTKPMDTYAPNAFGLYHMHGNVSEWCSDWYGRRYYLESPVDDPQGPATGDFRVIRGGSYLFREELARSARRDVAPPGYQFLDLGMRVVCEP